MRFALLAVPLLAFALGGPVASADPNGGPARWRYRIAITPGLDRMDVTACFGNSAPRLLTLDSGEAMPWIDVPAEGAGMRRAADGKGFDVDGLPYGGCVKYQVDLARLEKEDRRGAYSRGKDLVVRVGLFLLRPAHMTEDAAATVQFALPPGISASVPWTPTGPEFPAGSSGSYVLDGSAFGFYGFAAFGHFAIDRFAAAGTTIEAAVLDGKLAATAGGIRRWLSGAASAVGALYGGRFPRPKIQAIVHPSGASGRGDRVGFGASYPGGGGGLLLFLGSDSRDEELPGEWVAVHEMIHLTMPVIGQEDAWFSEGFATYYQEVLRARAGFQDERAAWEAIEEGFARGRVDRPGGTLAEASRKMHQKHSYHYVYWSGAATALRVDVELRRRSGGSRSIDDAMRLWARHVGGPLWYSAAELMREADQALGATAFDEVSSAALASDAFPDVAGIEELLGIHPASARETSVTLDDSAAGALVRRAIMARTPH